MALGPEPQVTLLFRMEFRNENIRFEVSPRLAREVSGLVGTNTYHRRWTGRVAELQEVEKLLVKSIVSAREGQMSGKQLTVRP